jgi:hypothetical protein
MLERWLAKAQAADYLHTTPERIDELLRQGRLTCSVFDGIELFFIENLDLFLLAQQKRPNDSDSPGPAKPPVSPTPQPSPERLEVRQECPREQVEHLLKKLADAQYAKMLADELKKSLDGSAYRSIPRKTVGARLARWCTPYREDKRTRAVTDLARQISTLLFGFIVPRDDSRVQEQI